MKNLAENDIKALFQESRQHTPPELADWVMGNLPQDQPLPDYLKAPLIGKWQWLIIAIISLMLLALGLNVEDTGLVDGYLERMNEYVPTLPSMAAPLKVVEFSVPISGLAGFALIGLISLYFLDQYLKKHLKA